MSHFVGGKMIGGFSSSLSYQRSQPLLVLRAISRFSQVILPVHPPVTNHEPPFHALLASDKQRPDATFRNLSNPVKIEPCALVGVSGMHQAQIGNALLQRLFPVPAIEDDRAKVPWMIVRMPIPISTQDVMNTHCKWKPFSRTDYPPTLHITGKMEIRRFLCVAD